MEPAQPIDLVKKYRIIFWVFIGVFSLIIIVGVYFFWRYNNNKVQSISEKDQKIAEQNLEIIKLNKSQSTNETSTSELQKTNAKLVEENDNLKAGIKKALAYNDVFKYITAVIRTHGGFSGWTDAEFNTGKTKAEATGDANFVSTINWAWYEVSVPVVDRVTRVWDEIAAGIENNLK